MQRVIISGHYDQSKVSGMIDCVAFYANDYIRREKKMLYVS